MVYSVYGTMQQMPAASGAGAGAPAVVRNALPVRLYAIQGQQHRKIGAELGMAGGKCSGRYAVPGVSRQDELAYGARDPHGHHATTRPLRGHADDLPLLQHPPRLAARRFVLQDSGWDEVVFRLSAGKEAVGVLSSPWPMAWAFNLLPSVHGQKAQGVDQ